MLGVGRMAAGVNRRRATREIAHYTERSSFQGAWREWYWQARFYPELSFRSWVASRNGTMAALRREFGREGSGGQ
jgi:hypothetical protein